MEVDLANTNDQRQLLLISNSTLHGRGYLDHVEAEIRDMTGGRGAVTFIPFAAQDWGTYTTKAQTRFQAMGFNLSSVHDQSNMRRAIEEAHVIFIGGGNTFRLLKQLYDHSLLDPIRRKVAQGAPFIGSSAGSIVACPSLKTTKDMPVVQPQSFEALGLVSFQISPHYLDSDPSSTHMGESQEERILQFLEENEAPVVGLREGSILRVTHASVMLKGPYAARIFRRGEPPVEVPSHSDLHDLLQTSDLPAGARI
jgi:dipeptidase E